MTSLTGFNFSGGKTFGDFAVLGFVAGAVLPELDPVEPSVVAGVVLGTVSTLSVTGVAEGDDVCARAWIKGAIEQTRAKTNTRRVIAGKTLRRSKYQNQPRINADRRESEKKNAEANNKYFQIRVYPENSAA